MSYSAILLEVKNNIAYITVNRPKSLNAMNRDVFNDIDKALEELRNNIEAKGIIITGAGEKAFVAGADITEFKDYDNEGALKLSLRGQEIFRRIELYPKPIIAAVNGFALGAGCEFAMACHMRLASETARFGQPEVNLGLIPGYAGTQRLTQLIGKGKAMELLMTADMIKAPEALQLGLVNHVVPQEELIEKCESIINKIATKGPIAIAKIVEAVDAYFDPKKDGSAEEARLFCECFGTEDYVEGTTAFVEKRKANFKGA